MCYQKSISYFSTNQTICCEYPKEPPQLDGSFVKLMGKKIFTTFSTLPYSYLTNPSLPSANLKNKIVCHHPTDTLKMPPTQNILWPFQRNNFLNSNNRHFFFIFNVFLTNELKYTYLLTWKIMSKVPANNFFKDGLSIYQAFPSFFKATIRNRYNQAPHLTQDTNGKVTTSQFVITNESQEVSPYRKMSEYSGKFGITSASIFCHSFH